MEEFRFTAHKVNTDKEISITIKLEDDGERAWVDLCDEAEEKAYSIAAKRLNCKTSEVEVSSE